MQRRAIPACQPDRGMEFPSGVMRCPSLFNVPSSFYILISLPAQPVDATPSDINLFSKGGVYDATDTGKAFGDLANRPVEPLEGETVVA
jgi:hypothetical protein